MAVTKVRCCFTVLLCIVLKHMLWATQLTASCVMHCRFCKFPQEFVLRLERPSKIQQIQILAHEYKVCVQAYTGSRNGAL